MLKGATRAGITGIINQLEGDMAATDDPEALGGLLKDNLKARGATLGAQVTSVRRKLPRKLAKEADAIVAAEQRARYRPDLPPIGEAQLKKARSGIAKHLTETDRKADRRAARKRWATGLVLNLMFAMVVIGLFFWFGRQL